MGPIAKSTVRTSFVLGLRLVVQAGTLLLVARMLGPEQFGAFAGIAALAVLLGAFSTFGTHLVLLGEVSKDKKQREEVLAYAVPTTLMGGSLLFLVYLAIYHLFLSEVALPIFVVVCIGVTEVILMPLFVFPVVEQIALEKTASSQLLTVIPLAFRMLAALGVMLLMPENPLDLFAFLYMLTALLILYAENFFSENGWPAIRRWQLIGKQDLKRSAGYATLALTAIGPSELDKILAVKLLPLGVSGVYAAISRVIGAAILPVIALLLSSMPRLFRDNEENLSRNKRLMDYIFISVFLYGLLLSGLLLLLLPVLEWLFGKQYAGMAEILPWLCFAVPGLALRTAAGSMLITMNKPWMRTGIEVFGMLALAASAIAFAQYLGAKGMALALAVSEWGMAVVSIRLSVYFRQKKWAP
jgi:O-antigen/teichoic acid export membrane protein